jgi:hypothetical protein
LQHSVKQHFKKPPALASGKPDPKRLYGNGTLYRLEKKLKDSATEG